jgi:hypothetical protein
MKVTAPPVGPVLAEKVQMNVTVVGVPVFAGMFSVDVVPPEQLLGAWSLTLAPLVPTDWKFT